MKISSKLNELKPIDLNCNVFDVYSYDGLSMQELLCQFFTKINECINLSNETIDLASWLVNEGLKIEVVNKLMLWLEDGTLENLINVNLFNTLNTQLTQNTSKVGVYCSELGMIPNDKSKGVSNSEILVNAINNGKKIIVDDIYYFNNDKIRNITNDVIITGDKGVSKLIFNSVGSHFELTENVKNVIIKNVDIIGIENPINKTNTTPEIFKFSNTINIENFVVNCCRFENGLRLLRNASTNPSHFENFIFNNNTLKNISARSSFIYIENCKYDNLIIKNNTVNNFDYIIFHVGISNGGLYTNEIYDGRLNTIIENNIVKCDDDWFGQSGLNSYYTFIVLEGSNCYFRYNHTEGVKSDYKCAIYDGYLSCENLTYTNNIWKNNICFIQNKDPNSNMLMKSKGGAGFKLYSNNTFIVEKEYCERINRNVELSIVGFYNVENSADKLYIKDNVIDVYYLSAVTSSNPIKKINISNNTIKANIIKGNLVYYMIEENKDYSDSYCIISNNIISGMDKRVRSEIEYLTFYNETDFTNKASRPNKVEIINNTFSGVMRFFIYKCSCNELNVSNNNLDVITIPNLLNCFMYGTSAKYSKVLKNNMIKSDGVLLGDTTSIGLVEEYTEFTTKGNYFSVSVDDGQAIHLRLPYYNKDATIKRVTQEVKIINESGVLKHFYITYKFGYDSNENRNYINFINTNDEDTTVLLNRRDGADSITNGLWSKIKVNNILNAEDVGYSLANNSSSGELRNYAGINTNSILTVVVKRTVTNI